MKAHIEFVYRHRVFFGWVAGLIFFGFPLSSWARQLGETTGNVSLAIAGLLLLTLAFKWIDERKFLSQLSGLKLLVAKNGLRSFAILIISIPIVSFNLQPSINVTQVRVYPFETGKPARVDLIIQNKNSDVTRIRGTYRIFVIKEGKKRWGAIGEELWAGMMIQDEKTYVDFTIPQPGTNTIALDGHVLTEEQVNGLKAGDDNTALFFMGVFLYSEWYGLPRRLEVCGSYRDRPGYLIRCHKHWEWTETMYR